MKTGKQIAKEINRLLNSLDGKRPDNMENVAKIEALEWVLGKAVESAIETIHVTEIRYGSDVWGHDIRYCNDAGCTTSDRYYSKIDAQDVVRGNCYELDPATGRIIAEVIQ